ncbi:hypothetical protein IFR05_006344 [Cadophora sp. M221]|nr:hypothetical protein IFR05_006344 [Cadophora sp. M221]
MFCTSLRKRSEWATVPSTLLSSQNPRWKEKSLKTHDIAIPVPQFKHDESRTLFFLLALSSSDLQDPASAMERIQHLYHHTGGRNAGILFLLNEKTPKGNGTIAMMNLQVRYNNYSLLLFQDLRLTALSLFSALEMPIIPLFSLSSFSTTLFAFQHQLVNKHQSATPPPIDQAISLLPYCTSNPTLPEHARNVVSDICHSLSEVSHAATTESGQQGLRDWLDGSVPGAAQDIIDFWAQELVVY